MATSQVTPDAATLTLKYKAGAVNTLAFAAADKVRFTYDEVLEAPVKVCVSATSVPLAAVEV